MNGDGDDGGDEDGTRRGSSLLLRDVTVYMCCSFVYDEGEREG